MRRERDGLAVVYVCSLGHKHVREARALECESRPSAKGSAQALFAPRSWTFSNMSEDAILARRAR